MKRCLQDRPCPRLGCVEPEVTDLFPTFLPVETQHHNWITPSDLPTPVVAIAAAIFAYGSFKTVQNKLKFELFEKQVVVYRPPNGSLEWRRFMYRQTITGTHSMGMTSGMTTSK